MPNLGVAADALYFAYTGDDFVEHENYPLDEMLRTRDGGAIVLCTSDEVDPSNAPVTGKQFGTTASPSNSALAGCSPLHRARSSGSRECEARVYWASHDPLPGGIAFENFEVRQRYVAAQQFIFRITSKEPWDFDPPVPHLQKPAGPQEH